MRAATANPLRKLDSADDFDGLTPNCIFFIDARIALRYIKIVVVALTTNFSGGEISLHVPLDPSPRDLCGMSKRALGLHRGAYPRITENAL
jgi:hypothetical protein